MERAAPPTTLAADLLFDARGLWRVFRNGARLLYTFREPQGGGVYQAATVDRRWRSGVLYSPPSPYDTIPGFALTYLLAEIAFQHHVAWRDGMIVHACGLVLDGRAVLLVGDSGAGKTTSARLWRRRAPEVRILSDDRVMLRRRAGRTMIYGSPWSGTGGFASNASAPLGAIFFLEKASRTRARRVEPGEAAVQLLARSFRPLWDAEATRRVMARCAAVARRVPCLRLEFRPDRTAVDAVREVLRESR